MKNKHQDSVSLTEPILHTLKPAIMPSSLESIEPLIDYETEIEDIISNRIPFIVRWGTAIFCCFLLLLSLFCWFIQYPDIISAGGKLDSVNAPCKVITKIDGKLIHIAISQNNTVVANQVLGYMESTANPQSIIFIDSQISRISNLIQEKRFKDILRFFPTNAKSLFPVGLGELQQDYQVFMEEFIHFKEALNKGFLQRKMTMLQVDLRNIKRMNTVLKYQKGLLLQDLVLTNKTYEANKILGEKKVISQFDFRNETSKLLAKQLTLPQINVSIISNEAQLNQKIEEIAELDNQIITQQYRFVQALRTVKSQIQVWQAKYILKSPISGRITFIGFFQENQEMKAGEPLFYIQPDNSSYFIEVTIPQYNFGKVKLGQQVAIKFQAYPFAQYGAVIGRLQYIDNFPTDSGYLAKIILPDGLITNRKKQIRFQEGLMVQADIITENMRLFERLYFDLLKQIRA